MKVIKKYCSVFLVLAICAGICAMFCTRKQGFFIDEIYTYGLSNSAYAPYISDISGGTLSGHVFSREDLQDYLSAGESGRFSPGSVYYNQSRDVHPPLYYWIFNLVSSFFPGSYSKWIGLGINFTLYMLTLAALFALAKELYGSEDVSAAVCAVFGLSVIGLSIVMMIRMYALLTLFTVLLALAVARLLREPDKKAHYVSVCLVMYCGMMTQYYFVFYAFFLCAAYDIYALCTRKYKSALMFSAAALLGVGLMPLVFPASIKHLFVGNGQVVGGSSIAEKLLDFSGYGKSIEKFWLARKKFKAADLLFKLGIIPAVLSFVQLCRKKKTSSVNFRALVILLPVVPAFLLVAVISPVSEHRYIYNLVPILALGIGFLFHTCEKALPEGMIHRAATLALVCVCICSGVLFAKRLPPNTLFPEMAEYTALCREHAQDRCVYFSNEYFSCLTQDALQLMEFNDFLVTDSVSSPALEEYTAGEDEIIVFIDTSKNWSSGYDEEEILSSLAQQTDFKHSELLYRYDFEMNGGLSVAYVLTK